jgi:hypothetical protein
MDFNFATARRFLKILKRFPLECYPVQSNHKATVQILDSPRDDERVEVLLEEGVGSEQVVLRYSTWVEGLGWCSQKTMRLDCAHLDDLHRALTVARQRVRRKRAEGGQPMQPATVIQLPTIA